MFTAYVYMTNFCLNLGTVVSNDLSVSVVIKTHHSE